MLSLKNIFKADTEIQALLILVHNSAEIANLASKVLLYQFLLTHHPFILINLVAIVLADPRI